MQYYGWQASNIAPHITEVEVVHALGLVANKLDRAIESGGYLKNREDEIYAEFTLGPAHGSVGFWRDCVRNRYAFRGLMWLDKKHYCNKVCTSFVFRPKDEIVDRLRRINKKGGSP